MPLYTYVVTFRNANYVAQSRHSNFRGFVSGWTDELPLSALGGLTPDLKKLLSQKAIIGDFAELPNRTHVWQKALDLDGEKLTVTAVQTEP